MKLPTSRLLARLDAALAKTRDPVEAACLRTERAGFLARHGHMEEAQAEFAALHAQFDPRPQAAVSIWLCIAEGWLLHYGSLSAVARDKMKRAQALSAAAKLTRLHALSSAWLAQMDYAHGDWEAMARNAALALQLAGADQHAARARACLVVAVAYHFAERLDRAQPWYARAREHASADGDETTLSALNYNMMASRVHHAIQAAIFGGDAQGLARSAQAAMESTGNFDDWIGTASLDALIPMQRAGIASVQGQHAQALALYEAHLADAQKQGLARLMGSFLADVAWCRWHLGDAASALRDAQAAAASIDPAMDVDDRALAHGRLGELFKLLGDKDAGLHHSALARECWANHRQNQARVVAVLEAAKLVLPA